MPTPLVVFIPDSEQDALRSAGVLPPSCFEMCGSSLWNGVGDRVYFWPHPPDYGMSVQSGNPPPPAQLLGLETKGDEGLRSENLVAKLFGSTILHVLFLDSEAAGTHGLADMTPVLKLVRWVRSLNDSIRTWFSDVQRMNIRHAAVVVSRSGPFYLTEDQLDAIRSEFKESSPVHACYLVSSRLEVGQGHDAVHAKNLWPIIVGRLVLRLLIELSMKNPSEGIFLPGIHIIRSFEYLIDCPEEGIKNLKDEAQRAVYGIINAGVSDKTVASDADNSGKKPLRPLKVSNNELGVFPGLKSSLSANAAGAGQSEKEKLDWHRVNIEEIVKLSNDDARWNVARKRARDEFAECERKQFLEKEMDRVIAAKKIFSSVAKAPGNIRDAARDLQERKPPDTIGADVIYEKWQAMVSAERARKAAQQALEDAGREMKLAQNHYVTAPYGMLAVVATSLFCGYALVKIFLAVGGNGSLLTVLVLSALSAVGALCAWLVVSWFHRRAGCLAMEDIRDMVQSVDDKMNARHAMAVATVRTAEARHQVGLRRSAIAVLQRLLSRVDRIVEREMGSPTADVFYQNRDKTENRSGKPEPSDLRREELAIFTERTRFSNVLGVEQSNPNLRLGANVEKAIAEAFQESGDKSFLSFWKQLCSDTDGLNQQGNFPAKVFVPRIREWFRAFGGRLVMAQKLDAIASSLHGRQNGQHSGVLPPEFDNLRGDSGFALASADVPGMAVAASPRMVFVPESTDLETLANQKLTGGAGEHEIVVCRTPILGGLPQVAFFYQDIRVHGIGRDDADGRLVFLSRNGDPVKSLLESGVA